MASHTRRAHSFRKKLWSLVKLVYVVREDPQILPVVVCDVEPRVWSPLLHSTGVTHVNSRSEYVLVTLVARTQCGVLYEQVWRRRRYGVTAFNFWFVRRGRRGYRIIAGQWVNHSESFLVFSKPRNSAHFVEPDGSLSHSQQPAACPYPKPDQSSLCPPILLLEQQL